MPASRKRIIRDQWYADKRHIVKWSILLHIADKHRSKCIFQIAYFRKSAYGKLKIDETKYNIPPEVIEHFRNITTISELTPRLKIFLFDEQFEDRNIYLDNILSLICRNLNNERSIVFLDPDTGLEPAGSAGHSHVLKTELGSIWNEMPSGWILVFYQHKTNRNSQEWIEPKQKQFAETINMPLE